MTAVEIEIRSQSCAACILCGSSGEFIHLNQQDRLFGAWGSWNLKACKNAHCRLVWLDPMPLAEDIGKAYRAYYTHTAPSGVVHAGFVRRAYRAMKRGYQAHNYNYSGVASLGSRILGLLLPLFPICRGEADAEARFLDSVPNGRLLDVGCGSGEWLMLMRQLGWRVEGVDFDANAVAAARRHGLDVRCGVLNDHGFPDDYFDAITLSHVIEHVFDPVGTLSECRRILKSGGTIVVATPNNSSLGHRIFKSHWRGLEPPRHLHIFSPESLRHALELAGFKRVTIRPQVSRSVIQESFLLWRGASDESATLGHSWPAWVATRILNAVELCLVPFVPSTSDCMSAISLK